MPVVIALLRGVNVGGNNKLPMETLRAICGSLGHEGTVTFIQSGNAVFRTSETDLAKLAERLESAIQARCGFRPAVALRTIADLVRVIAASPFNGREGISPAQLLVTFLVRDPGGAAREAVRAIDVAPEELHALAAELYTYYVNGIGKSKLPAKAVERAVGCAGTARNWNTVLKLLEIAQAVEGGSEATSRPPAARLRTQ